MIRNTQGQDVRLTPQKTTVRRWIIAGVFLAGALAWAGYHLSHLRLAEHSIHRDRLTLATVRVADLERDLVAPATIVAANSPTLYAPEQGVVTFLVKAGDRVTQGQRLAIIESHDIANLLAQAEAEFTRLQTAYARQTIESKQQKLANQQAVELAHINVTAAKRELRRAEKSIQQRLISQLDFETARDNKNRAQLALSQTQQNAALAIEALDFDLHTRKLELERQGLVVDEYRRRVAALTIISPVEGMVGNWLIDQQSAVPKHQGLLTVVDLSSFEVEAYVPEHYAEELGHQLPVELQLGVHTVAGEIMAVAPEVIDNRVQVRIRFLDDPLTESQSPLKPGLRQNQRLQARIILERKPQVVSVPRGAFMNEGKIWRVQDDWAEPILLSLGAIGSKRVEILNGLSVGDTVIVSSTEAFEDAQSLLLTH